MARHLIFHDRRHHGAQLHRQSGLGGLEWWDRKITTDGSSNDASRHTSRFLAACAAIKDKGIRVWVIAFTASLSTDLTTCASPNSSYTASDAAGLNTAFQTIAKEVGELRVVQ
ncbi:hypothetical protein ACFSTD_09160 [Novosphingobium colocasiae]